jgi:phosphoglycolate phosphatase-like HAD superfamily hydrolase
MAGHDAVMFDLDGVLVDSRVPFARGINTVGRAIAALEPGAGPVMVGDRSYDVNAAHDHGIRAIGVLRGIGSEQELRAAGADALARTTDDLAGLLRAGSSDPRRAPPSGVAYSRQDGPGARPSDANRCREGPSR